MNKITGYFTHVIFESADGNRNIYNFVYDLDNATQNKVPVLMPTRQDITGEIITIEGDVRYHKKFGVQFEAKNIVKTKKPKKKSCEKLQDASYESNNESLIIDNPPTMPQEYYDSMLIEYCHEQEKLYDFFTPEN